MRHRLLVTIALVALGTGCDQGGPALTDPTAAAGDPRSTLSYCTSMPDGAGPDFYRELDAANARMHREMAILPSGDPDRDFARLMIPHHQGAIEMALIELKYGRDRRLRRLAQAILAEQTQEILYMRALLDTPSTANATPADNN